MPSVGGFEFFQNYICTLNNTCYDDYVENTDSSRWDDAMYGLILNFTIFYRIPVQCNIITWS